MLTTTFKEKLEGIIPKKDCFLDYIDTLHPKSVSSSPSDWKTFTGIRRCVGGAGHAFY